MAKYGNIFTDDITNWMIDESGFKYQHFQIYIYLQVCTRWIQFICVVLCL